MTPTRRSEHLLLALLLALLRGEEAPDAWSAVLGLALAPPTPLPLPLPSLPPGAPAASRTSRRMSSGSSLRTASSSSLTSYRKYRAGGGRF